MLKFNDKEKEGFLDKFENLNTSYVKVQQFPKLSCSSIQFNLNTSYVKVQLIIYLCFKRNVSI